MSILLHILPLLYCLRVDVLSHIEQNKAIHDKFLVAYLAL